MKILYLRKSNIKYSNIRQNYLISEDKQEHLLYSSNLNFDYDFKNINKELVIELPNELMASVDNNELSYEDIHNFYVDKFKKISGYQNVAASIHLNHSKSNLHMHLSYVDRKLESKPKLAKKDMYIYSSSGKRIRDKSKYDRFNPNHLKIKKGETLLDYSKIDDVTKSMFKTILTSKPNKDSSLDDKFALRDRIKHTYKMESEFKYSKCKESGLNIVEQKKILNFYKKEFTNLGNALLLEYNYDSKYVSKGDFKKFGLETQKKIGKVNKKENTIQENNSLYNNIVKEYNNTLLSFMLDDSIDDKSKMSIINEEKQRKKEYKRQKLDDDKIANAMLNRLKNLQVGIKQITNIIERGKDYIKNKYKERTRSFGQDREPSRERVRSNDRFAEPELTL